MISYKHNDKKGHSCPTVSKISYIIITYLLCNRGKKYTSKQIWSFIMENQLIPSGRGMPRHTYLASMVRLDKSRSKGILSRVKMEGEHPILFYIP